VSIEDALGAHGGTRGRLGAYAWGSIACSPAPGGGWRLLHRVYERRPEKHGGAYVLRPSCVKNKPGLTNDSEVCVSNPSCVQQRFSPTSFRILSNPVLHPACAAPCRSLSTCCSPLLPDSNPGLTGLRIGPRPLVQHPALVRHLRAPAVAHAVGRHLRHLRRSVHGGAYIVQPSATPLSSRQTHHVDPTHARRVTTPVALPHPGLVDTRLV